MCVLNREGEVVGVAEKRKCKMCVCNREGEVVGVAEERKCKICVCVTGRLKVWQERGSVRCVCV